ncbi:alpha/beta fold hydrolase [Nocardia spumae]|uniref:alpha/beta fold hydrolase n=1 Tax=Nocardia spumae TaxID=2887190 RepID=UPI001D137F3B|nr:alpha/beta hydrolase [Nocardia spumae]
MRVVLIHGAATESTVWGDTVGELPAHWDTICPQRPQSGDLETEVAALATVCEDAYVVGVGGGATLGLELAARGIPVRGALLHEPAAGSLAPGLLAPVAAALREGGVERFGRTLYGPRWTPERTHATPATVGAELAMFLGFEPRPLGAAATRITLTVGAQSPPARHLSVDRLAAFLGTAVRAIPGSGHAVHLERPAALAALVAELAEPG